MVEPGGGGEDHPHPHPHPHPHSHHHHHHHDDGAQPVHPFLRMYQTRPGAFARLLSREADLRLARVLPGSTIASLLVPHPAVVAARVRGHGGEEGEGDGERRVGQEAEEEEEFEECVQGTTM